MKAYHWIIVILLLSLFICLYFLIIDNGRVPVSKTVSIDCSSGDSFAEKVKNAREGEVIVLESDCDNTGLIELPAVIENNNITLLGKGNTITGNSKLDILTITGNNVIVRNINFKEGMNGVVVRNGGSAILDNVSATHNKGTGLCVIGGSPIQMQSNLRAVEKLQQPSKLNPCYSTLEKQKYNSSNNNYFSLINNAMATHRPNHLDGSMALVCKGDYSANDVNGGDIELGSFVTFYDCGLGKVKFNNNGNNGLLINFSSTVVVKGAEIDANDNADSGLVIDGGSNLHFSSGGKINTLNISQNPSSNLPLSDLPPSAPPPSNQSKGIVVKRGILVLTQSGAGPSQEIVTSEGNDIWDLENNVGSFVICSGGATYKATKESNQGSILSCKEQ